MQELKRERVQELKRARGQEGKSTRGQDGMKWASEFEDLVLGTSTGLRIYCYSQKNLSLSIYRTSVNGDLVCKKVRLSLTGDVVCKINYVTCIESKLPKSEMRPTSPK